MQRLKNYYFILGLSIYASESEIKRAYRHLALQFHPDKNPSEQAETIFKEINEAYETLGDSEKKLAYDQLLRGIPQDIPAPSRPHRDPRYKPRAPGSYSRKSRGQELIDVMNENLKYALFISRITFGFALLIVLDFSLPKEKTELQVLSSSYSKEIRASNMLQLNLEDGAAISLSREDAGEFIKTRKVMIYSSSVFAIPVTVESERTHFKAKIPVSIYGNFIFCPLIMLITSLLGTFYWKGVEFRFNLGVVNFFLALLSLLFLRIHLF